MKSIFCDECRDLVMLRFHKRICECGRCGGRYREDGMHIEIFGPCKILGFNNNSLLYAIMKTPNNEGRGVNFTAFTIANNSPRVHQIQEEELNELRDQTSQTV